MRIATGLFVALWVLAPFAWTAAMLLAGRPDATISTVVVETSARYPIVTVLLSGLAFAALAHWFWPLEPQE